MEPLSVVHTRLLEQRLLGVCKLAADAVGKAEVVLSPGNAWAALTGIVGQQEIEKARRRFPQMIKGHPQLLTASGLMHVHGLLLILLQIGLAVPVCIWEPLVDRLRRAAEPEQLQLVVAAPACASAVRQVQTKEDEVHAILHFGFCFPGWPEQQVAKGFAALLDSDSKRIRPSMSMGFAIHVRQVNQNHAA